MKTRDENKAIRVVKQNLKKYKNEISNIINKGSTTNSPALQLNKSSDVIEIYSIQNIQKIKGRI